MPRDTHASARQTPPRLYCATRIHFVRLTIPISSRIYVSFVPRDSGPVQRRAITTRIAFLTFHSASLRWERRYRPRPGTRPFVRAEYRLELERNRRQIALLTFDRFCFSPITFSGWNFGKDAEFFFRLFATLRVVLLFVESERKHGI